MKQLEPTIENQHCRYCRSSWHHRTSQCLHLILCRLYGHPLGYSAGSKLAIALDVVDQPGGQKSHLLIAYLGGLAVFVGIMAGVCPLRSWRHLDQYRLVPISVVFGLIVIFITELAMTCLVGIRGSKLPVR